MSVRFNSLAHFIQSEMRMSHIYQPVMLAKLLQNKGAATVREIAQALAKYDVAQLEYYEKITRDMVGRVLTKNRGITTKEKDVYRLKGFAELSAAESDALAHICFQKINDYIKKRGESIWAHRKKSSGAIAGTLRYEVLKRAKFRCELCGVSADIKALEIDHILPRSKGGSDEQFNLQALCYSCNAMKRDRDDTDFREVRESYTRRASECLFCHIEPQRIVEENELCFSVYDGYPVTAKHLLVIPKRHVTDYFDLHQPEKNAAQFLLEKGRKDIRRKDSAVSGFNVGINIGKDAGQTIFHCHIHLIPRRAGDIADPRGGVRGVIPSKQRY